MCTIVIQSASAAQPQILLGMNRDEQLNRPSGGPALRETDNGKPYLAPIDCKAGGTWLGCSPDGLLVCLTNRFSTLRDETRRSRGQIIPELMEVTTLRQARHQLDELSPTEFNPFHIVITAPEGQIVGLSDGAQFTATSRETPELTVMTEQSFGVTADPKRAETRRLCKAHGNLDVSSLSRILSTCPSNNQTAAPCLRYPEYNYGTRASTICAIGPETQLLHAEGPPCQTEYENLTHLLDNLFETSGVRTWLP